MMKRNLETHPYSADERSVLEHLRKYDIDTNEIADDPLNARSHSIAFGIGSGSGLAAASHADRALCVVVSSVGAPVVTSKL
jgi:hypothetical protein